MKILVLQLARLGDIYLTWPAIRAIKRKLPEATIDVLVREKFQDATQGLAEVDRVLSFDTKHIFKPIDLQ